MSLRYDAHLHLHDRRLAACEAEWLDDATSARIGGAMTNGLEEADWDRVAEIRSRLPWVRASYGLHPWYIPRRTESWTATLAHHLAADPSAGVGEIGLDGWILTEPGRQRLLRDGLGPAPASLELQREIFRRQLAEAHRSGRICSIHCLRAWSELLADLRHTPADPRGFLVHAFSGPPACLTELLDLGAYVSFNAAFLSPRHSERCQLYRRVPRDRLLVETDAPDMPPPPGPGVRLLAREPGQPPLNHPGNLALAYQGLAGVLGWSLPRLEDQVAENFVRLFGAPPPSPAPVRRPGP